MKEALAFSRLKPDRFLGRISIVIFCIVVLYQIAAIMTFETFNVEGKRHYVSEADFITSLFMSMNGAPHAKRSEQANEIMAAAPYVRLVLIESLPDKKAAAFRDDPVFNAEVERINQHLRGGLLAFPVQWPDDEGVTAIGTQLAGGPYCLVSIDQGKKPANLLWRWITDPEPAIPLLLTRLPRALLLYLITVCIIVFWLAREIVSPIIKLSREVRAVSLDGDYSMRITERGSEEIRDLTRSINEMHRKIFDMALHRRYALAGLSHDLKTILTRLKLRAEFIREQETRWKFQQDLALMDTMVERNMEFLKAEGVNSDNVVIDLESLIDTVIDQFVGCGANIELSGAGGLSIENSISDLFRIMTNIISNAVKYAANIQIAVSAAGEQIRIDVSDDGPGVPDELKQSVFAPFVRGDPELPLRDDGGFGLGLSIVQTLLSRQGGQIELLDNAPKGLIVRMTIHRRVSQARAVTSQSGA